MTSARLSVDSLTLRYQVRGTTVCDNLRGVRCR